MKESLIVFDHTCIEGRREVNRTVWLMEFDQVNFKKLWEKSKEHRILFTDDVNGNFQKFCSVFFSENIYGQMTPNGLVWVVDDFVGILFMSDIKPREALLHFSFFDGRLRLDIATRMIEYIFKEYNFDRLNAEIVPFANRRVFNFVETIGFKHEGTKRQGLTYMNKKFELLQYGLLREEFEEKWDTKKRQSEAVQLSS